MDAGYDHHPDSARTAPSSRSAADRAADAARRNSTSLTGGAGATLLLALTMLAEVMEKWGKISSASGWTQALIGATAIVLLSLYLQRQEQRDERAAADRERARNAYQSMVERAIDRRADEVHDAAADLRSHITAEVRGAEGRLLKALTTGEQRRIAGAPPPAPGDRTGPITGPIRERKRTLPGTGAER